MAAVNRTFVGRLQFGSVTYWRSVDLKVSKWWSDETVQIEICSQSFYGHAIIDWGWGRFKWPKSVFFGITDVLFFPKFIGFCGLSKLLPQLNPFSFGFREISAEHGLSSVLSFYPFNSSRLTAGRPRNDGRGRYSQISQHENLSKNYNQSAFFHLLTEKITSRGKNLL